MPLVMQLFLLIHPRRNLGPFLNNCKNVTLVSEGFLENGKYLRLLPVFPLGFPQHQLLGVKVLGEKLWKKLNKKNFEAQVASEWTTGSLEIHPLGIKSQNRDCRLYWTMPCLVKIKHSITTQTIYNKICTQLPNWYTKNTVSRKKI